MDRLLIRILGFINRQELIPPAGEVLCLVSGGPDSTCLYHALRELGYRVSALHVDHGLRGAESDEDARFCREQFGAEIVEATGRTEAELRAARYALAGDRLRATGHTATDQVETIVYRLAASGRATGIRAKRDDGIVRPLLRVWRDETETFCRSRGYPFRVDRSNRDTKRGLIRDDIVPLLRRLHPDAERNLLRALDEREVMPPALASLLRERDGSKRLVLGAGVTVVREYDVVRVERSPTSLDGPVEWGGWRIEAAVPGLRVRAWRAGDRLAGRTRKIQDVFVDAKIPRSEREGWPLVVRGDEVVAVPGIVDHPEVQVTRVTD